MNDEVAVFGVKGVESGVVTLLQCDGHRGAYAGEHGCFSCIKGRLIVLDLAGEAVHQLGSVSGVGSIRLPDVVHEVDAEGGGSGVVVGVLELGALDSGVVLNNSSSADVGAGGGVGNGCVDLDDGGKR